MLIGITDMQRIAGNRSADGKGAAVGDGGEFVEVIGRERLDESVFGARLQVPVFTFVAKGHCNANFPSGNSHILSSLSRWTRLLSSSSQLTHCRPQPSAEYASALSLPISLETFLISKLVNGRPESVVILKFGLGQLSTFLSKM